MKTVNYIELITIESIYHLSSGNAGDLFGKQTSLSFPHSECSHRERPVVLAHEQVSLSPLEVSIT